MKAVILAGGLGTRISEATVDKPKPMVEIGGQPILWHIMKTYYYFGVKEFIICLGYKGNLIKEYFRNYQLFSSNVTIDFPSGNVLRHGSGVEDWRVTLIDTGQLAQTGSRVKKILPLVEDSEFFFMTYGDGVANIDISDLLKFHLSQGRLATVTATRPPGRFGALEIDNDSSNLVSEFVEKPVGDGGYINGGFFVLSPKIDRYLSDGDQLVWEQEPLRNLASDGELSAYKHDGFWRPMDTLRDHAYLEELWASGKAPWHLW
jgi:glucose-1-phosphate cytidylyltransferase